MHPKYIENVSKIDMISKQIIFLFTANKYVNKWKLPLFARQKITLLWTHSQYLLTQLPKTLNFFSAQDET